MGKEPILKLINAIRNSNENANYIYKNGECYNFALILRSMFDGEIYYSRIMGHVWFKYKNKFYDIDGPCLKPPKDLYPLEHKVGHRPHRWNKYHRKIHKLINNL